MTTDSLVLKPSGINDPSRPWELAIREYPSYDRPDYHTLCYLSNETAKRLSQIEKGPYWLYGEPDWEELYRKEKLENLLKEIESLNRQEQVEIFLRTKAEIEKVVGEI